MFHAMRSKSVFGSTMFGMPLIRDIWFLYSCVSLSSWTFSIRIVLCFCMFLYCCTLYVCFCAAFMRNKRWWWWWYKSQYAAVYTQLCLRYWTVSWTELENRKNLINFQSMNLSTWHYTVVCRSLSLYMDTSETRSGAMDSKIIISKSNRKRSSTVLYRTFRSRFIHADDRNCWGPMNCVAEPLLYTA